MKSTLSNCFGTSCQQSPGNQNLLTDKEDISKIDYQHGRTARDRITYRKCQRRWTGVLLEPPLMEYSQYTNLCAALQPHVSIIPSRGHPGHSMTALQTE